MTLSDNSDQQWMMRALSLAEKGLFTTTPNPHVGCVLVKDGQAIGEGYTQPPGGAHAEVQAMRDAEAKGHDIKGATAYVTLEPCSHFGRTPPCADALIQQGIRKVVCAMEDPNPQVAGQGFAKLRAAGIEVVSGIMNKEAYELNIGFFTRMTRGTPWVRSKIAASLDAKTALLNKESQWITGQPARDDGHYWRARACAILAGIGTVRKDNPMMNVRAIDTSRQPTKIIVDSKLIVDTHLNVMQGDAPVWIFTASNDKEKIQQLEDFGAEVIVIPNAIGKVDLRQLLIELGKRQINELHVETGTLLNSALIHEHCIDELLLYIAPKLLGPGMEMFQLPLLEHLKDHIGLHFHSVQLIGEDLRILARMNKS